jgi:hypothetical protein
MELLSEEIRKGSYVYRLVKRGKKSLWYEQFCLESEKIVGWEVFKIKIDPPKELFGVQMGEREVFPGNEDFGKWAWSPLSFEKAAAYFEKLEQGTTLNPTEDHQQTI